MAIYMDFSNTEGAIGFIADGEPVIPVGVSIQSMPLSVKKKEGPLYEAFAQENDIHFLFEDELPAVDFYAVPKVDIAATDSAGGFIASVGTNFDLHDHVPLIYISPARECFLITEDSSQFPSLASCWKTKLVPYEGVTLYASKYAALKDYPILNVVDTEEYRMLMELKPE